MKDPETEKLETELRHLRPARSSETFVSDLKQAMRQESLASSGSGVGDEYSVHPADDLAVSGVWRGWWKWLAPALGVVAIAAFILINRTQPDAAPEAIAQNPEQPVVDEVELDQWLVAAFEGVAELPGGGPPVRFRCYRWQEDLLFRDIAGGIEVAQQGPRLELIPLGFDVY